MLKEAAIYFCGVFGTGFILGTIRVLLLLLIVGTRTAELIEAPLMLLAIILAARWVCRHFCQPDEPWRRLGVGLIAMGFVLVGDLAVGIGLRGQSLVEVFTNRDPVSGAVYYVLLGVYGMMPWLLSRRKQEGRERM